MSSLRLSKSRYLTGLQCLKRLWWSVREPQAPELLAGSEAVQLVRGRAVGELAQRQVPGGVLLDLPHYALAERVAATARALAEGATAVYEASFEAGGGFVSVDILERDGNGFVLTEVKSTLDVKVSHLPDVAMQAHVLSSAGLDVTRVEVMHLNRECRHPDLSNLFVRDDVTTAMQAELAALPAHVAEMQRVLAEPLPPDVEPGSHCSVPYPCPFQGRCWPALPEYHLGSLYRISRKKLQKLTDAGHLTLLDLPDDFEASKVAKRQIRSARSGELIIEAGLRAALAKFAEPIAFLDFETVMPAVPAWPGCGPYDHVPVQLSCHVLMDGELVHHEWLAQGGADPRPAFAAALLAACAGAQTIVAYNAAFELQRIEALSALCPQLAPALDALCDRIVDLLPILRNHVYHPQFQGSFSLKSVLPALVEDLSYAGLAIHDGATAAATLESLLLFSEALPTTEMAELRRNLLAYCELDTLAMGPPPRTTIGAIRNPQLPPVARAPPPGAPEATKIQCADSVHTDWSFETG